MDRILTHVVTRGEIHMHNFKLMKVSLTRLLRGACCTLAAAGMLFAANSAGAACGGPSGIKSGIVLKMPFLAQPSGAGPAQPALESGAEIAGNKNSIVGLWHVIYTSGGLPLYEAFDQWHGDGTELENPNLAPSTGPLCVGVWKHTGPRTFRLHHVGWNFDANGNSLGTFTLKETNTVGHNGKSYQGTFRLTFYDVDGNIIEEVTGTQTARRITVN
jgi:hypothetical protein